MLPVLTLLGAAGAGAAAPYGFAFFTSGAGFAYGLIAVGLATTGLAATGLAATGLAATGLAATGLAAAGLAAAGLAGLTFAGGECSDHSMGRDSGLGGSGDLADLDLGFFLTGPPQSDRGLVSAVTTPKPAPANCLRRRCVSRVYRGETRHRLSGSNVLFAIKTRCPLCSHRRISSGPWVYERGSPFLPLVEPHPLAPALTVIRQRLHSHARPPPPLRDPAGHLARVDVGAVLGHHLERRRG